MGKAKPKNWAVGRWLIESMDQWDRDFIDEEVRGYFEFDARGSGSFQFGYVEARSTTGLANGTETPPWSSPGTAMMRWTRSRGVVGSCLRARNSGA